MKRNPLENLPEVPNFDVKVLNAQSDSSLTAAQYSGKMGIPGGEDQSPALGFSNVPKETESLIVQVYDPDAPTLGGFWHWTAINIPGDTKELLADSGNADSCNLPENAINMLNDAGFAGYVGAAPPEGETHRYYVVVSALDIKTLDVSKDASPNLINFQLNNHIIGRGFTVLEGSN